MRQYFLCAIAVGLTVSGCSASVNLLAASTESTLPSPSLKGTASPAAPAVAPAAIAPTPPPPNPYQQGLDRAMSAATLGQAAQSQDDWRLVASRWQQAIEWMQAVPGANPDRAQAQRKVTEYQRNLAFAQQQANRSTALRHPDGVIVVSRPQMPQSAPAPQFSAAPEARTPVFRAPILRRAGGTPVIAVTFNGTQRFEMVVDTGASGTLITPHMAAALNVVPVGQAMANTASARNVAFPLGYVRSIEVDGAIAPNMLIAVSGPELDVGLLGHDFFGNFDVTIRQDVVEFRPR